MKYTWTAAGLLAVLALAACGGGEDGTADTTDPGAVIGSTSQTVDASGGTVALQGLSLALPAAALSAATQLALQQETVASPALARFRFSPAGQVLTVPSELRYSAPGLPANVRFFWEVNGERWMIPGTVSGGVLTSQVASLGYNAAGTVQQAAATAPAKRVLTAAPPVRPLADGPSDGGSVVVAPVDCDAHITELKLRLARVAAAGDQDRALGVFNDLVATREACKDVRPRELQEASCSALSVAQSQARLLFADSLSTFSALTVPLYAGEAFVQATGATCTNANPAENPALVAGNFDQLLAVMKGQMTRAEFDDTLTVRDLRKVLQLDAMCQKLGLNTVCERLTNELYPDLLDALRRSAFEECRVNGTPLAVAQFYPLGSQLNDPDQFAGRARFSLAAVEADLSYCGNPSLDLKVLPTSGPDDELTDRATTLRPLVALGNYVKQKAIEVPREGTLEISGNVGVLRCPDGSASGADLVARINGREWRRTPASGNAFPLTAGATLRLTVDNALPSLGIDPAKLDDFTVTLNREGGACSDGNQPVLTEPFTLFEVKVNLPVVTLPAKQISSGSMHACAVTSAGGVKCWGYNSFGQLGNGSTTNSSSPVNVNGLGSGVVAVSAGYAHTCALTSAGGVMCWGQNAVGALGDGSNDDRSMPVPVSGLGSGVIAISAGGAHTCALTSAGGVKCWGDNDQGAVGDGSNTRRHFTPVDVSGLGSGVRAVSAGSGFTCALTSAGGVKCWGYNGNGRLGYDGRFAGSPSGRIPNDVTGLSSGVIAISAGTGHACAVTSAGGAKCWGQGGLYGQLGDGSRAEGFTPVNVSGLGSGVAAITAGLDHTCALTSAGGVKCWGSNTYGQVGAAELDVGPFVASFVPLNVTGLGRGVIAISAGFGYTCALIETGGAKCWGVNADGRLGNGSTTDSSTPVRVVNSP